MQLHIYGNSMFHCHALSAQPWNGLERMPTGCWREKTCVTLFLSFLFYWFSILCFVLIACFNHAAKHSLEGNFFRSGPICPLCPPSKAAATLYCRVLDKGVSRKKFDPVWLQFVAFALHCSNSHEEEPTLPPPPPDPACPRKEL